MRFFRIMYLFGNGAVDAGNLVVAGIFIPIVTKGNGGFPLSGRAVELDFCQIAAAVERLSIDIRYALGNNDACQSIATIERRRSNARHGFTVICRRNHNFRIRASSDAADTVCAVTVPFKRKTVIARFFDGRRRFLGACGRMRGGLMITNVRRGTKINKSRNTTDNDQRKQS